MPDSDERSAFGSLLRRQRLTAGLTQGVLAERAGLSARTIQDLERGIAQPRRETVRRLVAVLAPPPEIRDQLEAASPSPRDRHGLTDHVPRPDPSGDHVPPGLDRAVDKAGWIGSQRSLPVLLTPTVGRDEELAAVADLLSTTHLLTLTGVGGVGKTRLAVEVARAAEADYADGVWLVELAALAEPALVPQTVAKVFGIAEQPGRTMIETLAGALQTRQILLVLDNCEHLLDGCAALVERLLTACDGPRVLATSREPLGMDGELIWRVPPLAVPEPSAATSNADLIDYGAVRLFTDRARLVQPSFALTEDVAPAVVEICRRVDGIPLAIELAAARVPFLTVGEIAARLDDQLGLLTHGRRTAVPRQRTLRATLDWSHDLLARPEQALLRRLAVFAGGWTLEAAESVCRGDGLDRAEILELLSRLVDASLVVVAEQTGQARYRLLEPVCQYARGQLQRVPEEEAAARHRHASWCLGLTEGADPSLWPALRPGWRDLLRVERDNLRGALAWCLDHDPPTGLRLASRLGWWWSVESLLEEGRHWLEACLARCAGETPDHVRALYGLGRLAWSQGDRSTACALIERSLALARRIGDLFGQTEALRSLGNLRADLGAVEAARAYLDEGLVLVRELGNRRGIAGNLAWLGNLDLMVAEYDRARMRYEEGLGIARTLDDPWLLANVLTNLGVVATSKGEYRRARACFEEATAVMNADATPSLIGYLTWWKSHLAYCQGDLAQAAALYEEAVAVGRRYRGRGLIASALYGLARVTLARGDPAGATAQAEESLRLLDPADEVRRSSALFVQGLALAQQGDAAQGEALVRECLAMRAKARRRVLVAGCLEALAQLASDTGRAARAARLLGAADALRASIGAPVPPIERADIEVATDAVRALLGVDAFTQARAEGRAMSFEQAVAYALDVPA